MSFFNNALIKLGLNIDDCIGGDKVTLIDGIGCHIEGQKGISNISQENICVKTAKHLLVIEGQDLNVVSISTDEIFIVGQVTCVSRQKR